MSRSTADQSDSSAAADSSGNEFAIVCSCGQPHAGQRRRRHQQILCKECGTALFVLPLDVYPRPTAGGKKRRGKKSGRFAIGDSLAAVGNTLSRTLVAFCSLVGDSFRRSAKMLFSPWKIGIYGLVFVVFGTGWFLHRRGEIAEAEVTVTVDADAGNDALKLGRYDVAEERLTAAADAVRLLGRTDETSRRIEQAAREATVLANLASDSLLDVLSEVEEAGVDSNLEWKRPQQIGLRDQWLAFDASVEKRDGKFAVVLPVRVGNPPSPVFLRVDSDVFEAVPLDAEPRLIVFAGQISQVRRLPNAWDVVIDPDSIFFWESFDLYAPLGFVVDPVWNTSELVAERLALQREWQGGEELPGDNVSVSEIADDRNEDADGGTQ